MAVKLSRFYNDPSIGKGFENLAGAFAPPEATDQLASVRAVSEHEKASRLAELFTAAKNPGVTREQLDRIGIGSGAYNPNQSYHAVDQGNATTLSTNAADNARALQQTRMTNDTSVATNANTVRGNTVSSLFGALNEGQIRPDVPVEVAATIGLPALAATRGAPKPLSESEMKGRIIGGLPLNEQRAVALQSVPTDNVVTPEGPRIAFRPDAVGQQPAATPVEPQSATNYRTPDGTEGTAVLRNGQLVDSQSGQPLPARSVQFSTSVQGAKDATGLGTANVNKAGQQLLDLDVADTALDAYAKLLVENPGAQGALGAARRTYQDAIATGGEFGEVLRKQDAEVQRLVGANRFSPEVLQKFGNFNSGLAAVEGARQRAIALQAAASGSGAQVSNRDVERVESEIGGGGLLANNAASLASIQQAKSTNAMVRQRLGAANPTAAGTFPGGGTAPAPAAPTPEAPRRRKFNPATGAIE